ncbi:CPBP family intramembrane glutamic endopeptidase [Oceanobacillus timonensis]|uniref:CPBP family intramembrane glutamic endopeptidase n=1 Tax=Oceanobacillus timonensis TaxID=1926285 RepID=UPI0009BC4EEF|nr:CPBP family intramembrane glutamic endopeptidase [Oceanobacillus timonensis]
MNWIYLAIVLSICIPGIYFMYQSEKIHIKEDDVTDGQRLIAHGLTALIFSAMGAYFVPKIHVVQQIEISQILLYGLGLGVICSLSHLLFYYMYLVPRLTKTDYMEIETHYVNTGILSRVFYGGVIEEVMFRWGLLSLFIWLFQLMSIGDCLSTLFAISISCILFAFVHLPSIKLVVSQPKPLLYVYTIVANIWVGIFAGVAFIQGGLLAAIIVHMLFHLIWWPIQKRKYVKLHSK